VASCGRTGPAARCLFRRAPAAAGLYGTEEAARRSFNPPTESNQAGIRRVDRAGPHAYPANLCLFFGDAKFLGFRENLGEPIGESVEGAAWCTVRQGAAEHLE
jgi:hypothetical protein